jgi:FAD/FMN-containing dehydrogenase
LTDLSIFPHETIVRDPDLIVPRLTDFRRRFTGRAAGLLLPRSVAEVSAILRAASLANIPVVPQGGNTSYSGGATPDDSGRAVILGFDRMNSVREIDVENRSMTVEAGCILQTARDAAAERNLLLPVSLGAQGSCRIGGNIGTNAGGLNVLRYGMTRASVLGLEVVLADGTILDTLSPLRKDNSGLRVEDLFVGTEGTLGIVTAASLALAPRPVRSATAFLAVDDVAGLPVLLSRLRVATGDGVSAFEYLSKGSLDLVADLWGKRVHPLSEPFEHAVLVEVGTSAALFDIEAAFEAALSDAMEDGSVIDGTVATSGPQRDALWRAREEVPEAEVHAGGSIKHDLAVRTSDVPRLLNSAREIIAGAGLPIRSSIYGHVGDGNVHLNLLSNDPALSLDVIEETISPALYDLTTQMGGTFSAEYGLGQAKLGLDAEYGDAAKRRVAMAIKSVLDPTFILNPGKCMGTTGLERVCMPNVKTRPVYMGKTRPT